MPSDTPRTAQDLPPVPSEIGFRLTAIRPCPGHLYGLRQRPVFAQVVVDTREAPADHMRAVHARLAPLMPPDAEQFDLAQRALPAQIGAASLLIAAAAAAGLEEGAGGIVVDRPRLLIGPKAEGTLHRARLALPTVSPNMGSATLQWVVKLAERLLREDIAEDELTAMVDAALDGMGKHAPPGSNNRSFFKEALLTDLPYLPLPGGVIQYGYGAGARIFKSTMTDATPAIAAHLATDKRATNALLQMGGFPVADQASVASLDEALAAARKLGFPVVVKPSDQEQGRGVSAGLRDEAQVTRAFEIARAASRNIIVEKHIVGSDFRINMIGGQPYSTIQKIPAHVIGDGVQTVQALIDATNKDPRRSPRPFSKLKRIAIDDELTELLADNGLSLGSVPEKGRFVRLRRNSNVSRGGTTKPVSSIHPQIAEVCRRVVRLYNLDIAGLDIIAPDLDHPLSQTGGVIGEVNAQPEVGATFPAVYDVVFDTFVPHGRDMRFALVLTDDPRSWPDAMRDRAAVMGALIDRDRESLLWASDGAAFQHQGLPMDRLHALGIGPWAGPSDALRNFISLVLPHLRGPVVIAADHPALAYVKATVKKEALQLVASEEAVAETLRAVLARGAATADEARPTATSPGV